ncbi:MAG: response regulator [Haloarculaceae archaeon]
MGLVGDSGEHSEQTIDVLVVDDEPNVAQVVGEFLERADEPLSVTIETDPEAGLDRLHEEEFDAVVSDYQMPGMDGLTFLDRASDAAPSAEQLLYTHVDEARVREQARREGVGFLAKGTSPKRHGKLATRIRQRVETDDT